MPSTKTSPAGIGRRCQWFNSFSVEVRGMDTCAKFLCWHQVPVQQLHPDTAGIWSEFTICDMHFDAHMKLVQIENYSWKKALGCVSLVFIRKCIEVWGICIQSRILCDSVRLSPLDESLHLSKHVTAPLGKETMQVLFLVFNAFT